MLSGLVNRARAYWKGGRADHSGEVLQEALAGGIPFAVIANELGENMYDATRLDNEDRRSITKPEYWHARDNAVSAWLLFSQTTKGMRAASKHEDMQQSVFVHKPLLVNVLEYYLARGDIDNFLRLHMTPAFYDAWVVKGRPLATPLDYIDPELEVIPATSVEELNLRRRQQRLAPLITPKQIYDAFFNQPKSKIPHHAVLVRTYRENSKKLWFGLGRSGLVEELFLVLDGIRRRVGGKIIRPEWIMMGLYEGGHANVLTALRAELDQGRHASILANLPPDSVKTGFVRVIKRVLERDEHDLLLGLWTEKLPPYTRNINVGTACAHYLLGHAGGSLSDKLIGRWNVFNTIDMLPLLSNDTCDVFMQYPVHFCDAVRLAGYFNPEKWSIMTEPVARVVRMLMLDKSQPDTQWYYRAGNVQLSALASVRTDLLDTVFEFDQLNPAERNSIDVIAEDYLLSDQIIFTKKQATATYAQLAALTAFVKKRQSLSTDTLARNMYAKTHLVMTCTDAEWKLLLADPTFRALFSGVSRFLSAVALHGLSVQTIRALIDFRQYVPNRRTSDLEEAYHLFVGVRDSSTMEILQYFLEHVNWSLHDFFYYLFDYMRQYNMKNTLIVRRLDMSHFMDFVCFVAKHAAPAESAAELSFLADPMLTMDGNGPRRVVRVLDALAAAK